MFNMQRPFGLGLVCLSIVSLGGCCIDPHKRDATPPPERRVIGLAEAIKQVQAAVFEARQAPAAQKIGVVAGKVTFNLKLAAANTDAQGATTTLGVALGPVTVGAGSSDTFTVADSAESSITLELVNPLLADGDSILGTLIKKTSDLDQLTHMIDNTMKGTLDIELVR